MAVPAVRHRPGVGLIVAVVALAAAVGLAFGVSAVTADRSKPGSAPGPRPAAAASASSGSSAAATTPTIPAVKVTAVGLVKGFQPWSKAVTLHIKNGTLLSVQAVDDTGVALAGTAKGNNWSSTGQVIPNRTYQIQAYVLGKDGVKAYHTINLTAAGPGATIGNGVAPLTGRTVGIGFAIVVRFTAPVADADRAAVEGAMHVTTSTPVVGAWHWFSPTEVHYRPRSYWPAHTTVTLHQTLDSVQLSPGVWGDDHDDVNFTIGDAHITTVDTRTQHMTVTDNGKVVSFDTDHGQPVTYDKVSTGRKSLPTLNGIHVVLEKFAVKQMDSATLIPPIPQFLNGKKNPAYYDEKELWATRISDAGAFVHFNPLTVKVQGVAAASHGCVNTGLKQAKAFYMLSVPGDIVDVINSPAPPNLNDPGMQDWNYSWAQWLAGSATQS